MTYRVIKTYGNERGLSCAFRQWRAESHCRLIHGYSLGFKFTFEAKTLDDKNWVYDFGDMGFVKEFLEDNFDHILMVAFDDPRKQDLYNLDGIAEIRELPVVGCEAFAEYVYSYVNQEVEVQTTGRVKLVSVECFEHGANSALFGNF
jgi:6-pyruvoyltetrahydropterin/6-carboxytetrahydropterin synthase|tara:strand:+ start:1103 stop:1543 length:441 start_codon:yes stop_codon:yes gene_type:complete